MAVSALLHKECYSSTRTFGHRGKDRKPDLRFGELGISDIYKGRNSPGRWVHKLENRDM